MVVLSLPGLQHLARDVMYFLPDQLPEVSQFVEGDYSPISANGYPAHPSSRHIGPNPGIDLLVRWVKLNDDGKGRILVQGGMDGEELSWRTDAEILGGFQLRNVEQAYANLFRREVRGRVDRENLRRYLETYAVKWVIITRPAIWFDDKPDLMRFAARFAQYRIYRVEQNVDLFKQGSGTIEAETNRIQVSGTDPGQTLVLRYHWLETLVCEPDCTLERSPTGIGGADFIRIPAPHPRNLVIRNAY
jgi:hypothetical protein